MSELETREWKTVKIERKGDGITFLYMNRPEKRNAMNPTMCFEMCDILDLLTDDKETRVIVLTGAGEAWTAGMDLREFFRALDNDPAGRRKAAAANKEWAATKLRMNPKPTIAMVNGYCFGGGFSKLIACDIAIAADDSIFGLSEINWGIFPAGGLCRVLDDAMTLRDAMYYSLTGEPFDGKKASEMRLITMSVPREQLIAKTMEVAKVLASKNPTVLSAAKIAHKTTRGMDYWQADEYTLAKSIAMVAQDGEKGRSEGMKQFLDEKRYRPGLGNYIRETK